MVVLCLQEDALREDTVSPLVMRRSLTKRDILRNKKDIDRIFKSGKRFSSEKMRLIYLANGLSFDRFIIIPAKHYGNSVQRNLLRRRAKEIFRNWENRHIGENPLLNKGLDLVLVVYPGRVSDYSLLESDFKLLLDRIKRK